MKHCTKILVLLLAAVILLAGCDDGIPDNAEVCYSCKGSGVCVMCDGDGAWEFTDLMGGYQKCSWCRHDAGVCSKCDGKGYVIPRR